MLRPAQAAPTSPQLRPPPFPLLQALCAKSTQFLRYVVDQVQDCPEVLMLPQGAA
jgi:hypothetical protein